MNFLDIAKLLLKIKFASKNQVWWKC